MRPLPSSGARPGTAPTDAPDGGFRPGLPARKSRKGGSGGGGGDGDAENVPRGCVDPLGPSAVGAALGAFVVQPPLHGEPLLGVCEPQTLSKIASVTESALPEGKRGREGTGATVSGAVQSPRRASVLVICPSPRRGREPR